MGVGLSVYWAANLLHKIEPLATASGQIWAFVIAGLGGLVAMGLLERETLRPLTLGTVLTGIYGTGFLLLIGIVESYWRSGFRQNNIRSSTFRSAMFVIPFIILAAAWGPIVFTAQLMTVDIFVKMGALDFIAVKDVYEDVTGGLPYNIVKLETINFFAFFAGILALVFFILIWNLSLESKLAKTSDWGSQFRRLVAIWLLFLIIVGAVTVLPVFYETLDHYLLSGVTVQSLIPTEGIGGFFATLILGEKERSPFEFYRVSMWRVSAILFLIIPFFFSNNRHIFSDNFLYLP